MSGDVYYIITSGMIVAAAFFVLNPLGEYGWDPGTTAMLGFVLGCTVFITILLAQSTDTRRKNRKEAQ